MQDSQTLLSESLYESARLSISRWVQHSLIWLVQEMSLRSLLIHFHHAASPTLLRCICHRHHVVLLSSSLKCDLLDIDQLKKTMNMTGTPGPTLLQKITSEEVSLCLLLSFVVFSLHSPIHSSWTLS